MTNATAALRNYETREIPRSFQEGERIELLVNKLTSTKAFFPLDRYQLPFCVPDERSLRMAKQNLGQFLAGDRIQTSPYQVLMRKDMYCHQLCISSNLGAVSEKNNQNQGGGAGDVVQEAIRNNYHENWIIDNLSSASKFEDDRTITTRYWQGFPIGFIDPNHGEYYIYNHVNLEVEYSPVPSDLNKYRIVRFTVEPFSIKHDFEAYREDETMDDTTEYKKIAKIKNAIPSCRPGSVDHTSYDMVTAPGRKNQPASGNVLFTYDVIWMESMEKKWSERWDIYLTMDGAIPAKVHILSIANSVIVLVLLLAIITFILKRHWRQRHSGELSTRRRVRSNNHHHQHQQHQEVHDSRNDLLLQEEEVDDDGGLNSNMEEQQQQQQNGDGDDVDHDAEAMCSLPLVLALFCGTGAQILTASLVTLILLVSQTVQQSNRGDLVMTELLSFALMSSVNGFVTTRFYKTFRRGQTHPSWLRISAWSALSFPGMAFGFLVLNNLIAKSYHSTLALPLSSMITLLMLWFGVSTPLVVLGSYFGNKASRLFKYNPVRHSSDSSAPQQVSKETPCTMKVPFQALAGGLLPFGACFVELYFILNAVWFGQFYNEFEFLLLVLGLVTATCASVAILLTHTWLRHHHHHHQYHHGSYHFLWPSCFTSGSIGMYVFLYSFVYFRQLKMTNILAALYYFAFMAFVSFGLFLMMGFVGVVSSLILLQVWLKT